MSVSPYMAKGWFFWVLIRRTINKVSPLWLNKNSYLQSLYKEWFWEWFIFQLSGWSLPSLLKVHPKYAQFGIKQQAYGIAIADFCSSFSFYLPPLQFITQLIPLPQLLDLQLLSSQLRVIIVLFLQFPFFTSWSAKDIQAQNIKSRQCNRRQHSFF